MVLPKIPPHVTAKAIRKTISEQARNYRFPPLKLRNKSAQAGNFHFDQKVIKCVGGKGGDGFMMFRRERDQPRMGPDGGNGGNGGHVLVVGSKHHNNLAHLKWSRVAADQGGIGGRHHFGGANAQNKIIKVPLGTMIVNQESNTLIDVILRHDQEQLVAAGGFGGYGNHHFQCSTSTFPFKAVPSRELRPADNVTIRLQCLSVAHVALIGFENAGKSSIIQYFTNCNWLGNNVRPAIGVLGKLRRQLGISVSLADLPDFNINPDLALKYTMFAHKVAIIVDMEDEDCLHQLELITSQLTPQALKKSILIMNKEPLMADEIFSWRNENFPDMPLYVFPTDLDSWEKDISDYFCERVGAIYEERSAEMQREKPHLTDGVYKPFN